jgi:hypothetical protein
LICEDAGAELKVIDITDAGELRLDQAAALLTERTRLLAVNHVSNALGTINPVGELCALVRERGIPTLIDGAQATPHAVVDVQAIGSTFGGNPQNGSRVLTDDDSPFLVIQSDGTLFNDWREKDNWKEKTMSNFFSSAVSIAGDAVEGKIPCYEAQRRDPPISLTPHVPFNPVYLGVRHDNDRIFVEKDRDKDKDKDLLARRPKFENIPPGE